ncbi:hypothetical protein EPI10_024772 [Gossypium australe]|uniref:Uncharacterized protein n=1 Tax=Gossypium australe TaxID=47621 RepID=A0A5B6VZZ7_9ROSI|nr:hypothetical protein EPI10_024772 [Gossypium australe]
MRDILSGVKRRITKSMNQMLLAKYTAKEVFGALKEICDIFKINSTTDDVIRLWLFPFSLRNKAK